MKLFKNIVCKHRYRLKRMFVLSIICCAIILYNIGFSNKVFGGILDGGISDRDGIVVEYEPAKSSLPHGRTSGDVIARLTGADIDSITVTSEGGKEHIFTKTGSFTFKYKYNNAIDISNIKPKTIEAKVDWIDKDPPHCNIVSNTSGENYLLGCSKEGMQECTHGNGRAQLGIIIGALFGYESNCLKTCRESNIVEFTGQLTNNNVVVILTGCDEEIIITNNNHSNTYTFTENGDFTFEYEDLAGNPGGKTAHINGIKVITPECEVEYSTKSLTSGNVVATLTGCNKTLKNTTESYTFTKNETYKFILQDTEGNTGEVKAKVNWIDKESPKCTVAYNPSTNTTGEVLAVLTGCNEKITESETMFLFTDNGSYTFRYQDLAGNVSTTEATVDWILPDEVLTGITHTINDNTITLNWEKIEGYDGDVDFYLWYENSGEYKLLGKAALEDETFSFGMKRAGGHMIKIVPKNGGNIVYYSVPYENTHPTITPTCEVEYSSIQPTNQDVIVKLINCNENVYVTNTDGGNIFHTFSDNGSFTFKFMDDYGNTGESTANVDWIDKISPQCLISYSNENITTDPVIATVNIDSCTESIHFENGYESNYTFTQNGKHIFYFLDNVGNIGTAEANVSRITGDNQLGLSYAITGIHHMENDGDIILTWDVLNGKYIDIWLSHNNDTYTLLDGDINVNSQTYSFRSLGTGNYSIKFIPQNNLLESVYSFDIIETVEEWHGQITCEIIYSTHDATSGDVVATITGCNREIIDSNSTHMFTENGTYTFVFEDSIGNTGQAIAEVSWIDKTPPECIVSYSTSQTTNSDVSATISCNDPNTIIKNNNSQYTHIFTGNGEFVFEVSDTLGNTNLVAAQVDWIDKIPPQCTISYSTTQITSGDVSATISCDDPNTIIKNNNSQPTYSFTSNGEFVFEVSDIIGNTNLVAAQVDWIDKIPPQCSVSYSTTQTTSGDVSATISCDDPNTIIKNNNSQFTHVFTGNGEFVFEVSDTLGNMILVTTQVNWIDKTPPQCAISYSTSQTTYGDVSATISCDDPNTIIKNNNSQFTHVFTENGEFVFEVADTLGNTNSITTQVDWIEHIISCNIVYSISEPTNLDVVAELTGCDREIIIDSPIHTFTGNGTYTFYFEDTHGNNGQKIAQVDWIDKTPPQCSVSYSTTQATSGDVNATISCDDPDTIIRNNNSQPTYLFTGNGGFVFEVADTLGNTNSITTQVDWIDKTPPQCSVSYSTTQTTYGDVSATISCDDPNTIIKNNNSQFTHVFTENGEFVFEVADTLGNTNSITTQVDWIEHIISCNIVYSISEPTNLDVVAELTGCDREIIIDSPIHTFTGNGTYTFYFEDTHGNNGQKIAQVDWIDKTSPQCSVSYSTTQTTYSNVSATISCDDPNTIIKNNNSQLTHVFTGNGEFVFEVSDTLGNTTLVTAQVDWIDKTPPQCSVSYSTTQATSGDVNATISCDDPDTIIRNNNSQPTYLFTGNGGFVFEVSDTLGNTTLVITQVNWIDKTSPQCTVSYSTTQTTSGNVSATISCDDPNTIIKNNNSQSAHVFTGNGGFIFEVSDTLGNTTFVSAQVDWIEHIISCDIVYSISEPTNLDVIAELTGCDRDVIIDSPTHTFTRNGTYIFNFEDKDGNPGQEIAQVDWIDKISPQCTISYSTKKATNHNVNATISCDDPNTIIKNNNSQFTHVFTGNGEFVFEVSDTLGNTNSVRATVSRIDKKIPTCEINYSTVQETSGVVFATLKNCSEQIFAVSGYDLYHKFSANGYHTIIFKDSVGNIGNTKAEVTWIVQDTIGDDTPEEPEAPITYEYFITGVNHSFYDDTVILTWTALSSGDMDIIVSGLNVYFTKRIHINDGFFVLSPIMDYNIKFKSLNTAQEDVDYIIQKPDTPDNPSNPDTPDNPSNPDTPIEPIDNNTPTCDIVYSTTQKTSEEVIASLYGCSEEVIPLEGFYLSHIFTDNGNFMFYFVDNDGNIGTAWASVNWIVHDNTSDNTGNNTGNNTEIVENVDYALTGVYHTISGTKINITWTPLNHGIVEIYLWNVNNREFEKIGSTNINYGEFQTDLNGTGEYLFKLVPMNGDAITYFIFVDNYLWSGNTPVCKIKYDYVNNSVIASLTGCDRDISVINNNGNKNHVFENGENVFTFEFKDNVGNIGKVSAYIWYSENFDKYENNLIGNHLGLGNPSLNPNNQYLVIHSNTPFSGSFTITGNNILLDNGAVFECNVTCVLSSGNDLTISIDGLGTKSVSDIIVPGNFAGYISYPLPKSFYTNKLFVNFDLDIKKGPEGSCLIDDLTITSKPNSVTSTKKTGAETGTYYKSQEIEISGLPENTAIPIFANIDYTDTVIQGYGNCVNGDDSNVNYCEGKYITDVILYKNGKIVLGGETVGQNGDVFQIKVKSSIYENSNITTNLMFGHTNKSIISQFSVSTMTGEQTGEQVHGSAEFEYDYSSFDSQYDFEWNQAYQYSYFYGMTTKSPIKNADMNGNFTRIAMAKMLSKYAINVLGLKVDDSKKCSFNDVTWSENHAYDDGVTNACKLGIMGINMPGNNFRPYDLVTRAEFATALSRLLYNTEDGKIFYYSTHISKLRAKEIINNTNPDLIEKRGYVMLMLMRAKDTIN